MKKRLLSILLAAIMVFSLLPTTAFADTVTGLKGSGTADDPYLIGTLAELEYMAQQVNYGGDNKINTTDSVSAKNAYYRLTADISGLTTPIGYQATNTTNSTPFQGHFDGADHTVTVAIDKPDSYFAGLFGTINHSAVVSHVTVAGTVNGKFAGGIARTIDNGTVENCVNKAKVSGLSNAGGITGRLQDGSVDSCVNIGDVSISNVVGTSGGIAGDVAGTSVIKNCVNRGDVSTGLAVGGLAGDPDGTAITIANSMNLGDVTGSTGSDHGAGGLTGFLRGGCTVVNCASSGGVSGGKYNGGMVGLYIDGTLKDSYYDKDVTNAPSDAIGHVYSGSYTPTNALALTTTQMKAESGDDALITKLNGYRESDSYPTGWLKWYKEEGEYPTLPCHVNVISSANGSVTVGNAAPPAYNVADYFAKGDTVTLTVTPAEGYALKSLKYNDGVEDHDITEAKSFTMPAANVTVTAVFEEGTDAHTHKIGDDDVEFTPWGDKDGETTSLPTTSGNYYLTKDVTLSSQYQVKSTGDVVRVNLCLNGHVVDCNGKNFFVGANPNDYNSKVSLTIDDCDTTTSHKGYLAANGYWVHDEAGTHVLDTANGEKSYDPIIGGVITNSRGIGIFAELNLNGGTIAGFDSPSSYGSIVLYDNSRFIMNGGALIANLSQTGVYVYYPSCEFDMKGGIIRDNITTSNGGGVYVYKGVFNMTSGEISRNHADKGGGVYIGSQAEAKVSLTGGKICNNVAGTYGGGVFTWGTKEGSFMLGGSVKIYGNKVGEADSDVKENNGRPTIGLVDGNRAGMYVGIDCTSTGKFTTTNNATDDDAKHFFSNNAGRYISCSESNLCVSEITSGNYKVNVAPAENGMVYAPQYAAANAEVTLTAVPADGYELDHFTVTDADSGSVEVKDDKFTMPAKAVTVTATFQKAAPSIKVVKAKTGTPAAEVKNPVYGTAKTDYQLYDVTTPNFPVGTTPTLTLQWKKTTVESATWDGEAPTDVVLTTDGLITTSASTPAGNYTFRIITGTEGQPDFVSSGEVTLTVEKAAGSGSVSMTGWTYGGTANDPSPTSSTNGTNNVTYLYKEKDAEDTTYADTKPTNAGTYTVKATFAETDSHAAVTATADFTISKATDNGITGLTLTDWVYDTTANTPSATAKYGNDTIKYTYSDDENGTFKDTVPTAAGIYWVKASVAETDNYNGAEAKLSFSITKATGSGSVTLEGWTYGGTANNPSPTSSTNGTDNVTYKYKVQGAEDTTYTDTKPTNAGTYTVKATFAATDNYSECSDTADFTIAKANYTDVTTTASGNLKPESGNTVEITLPTIPDGATYGTVTKKIAEDKYTLSAISGDKITATSTGITAAGDMTFTVLVDADDNHNDYTITVTITPVFKTLVTVTADTENFTYGDSGKTGYKNVSVTDHNDLVSSLIATYYLADGTTKTNTTKGASTEGGMPTKAGTYKVVLSVPEANETYTGCSDPIQFTISKANQTAPGKGEGYKLDEAFKITIDSGYEVNIAEAFTDTYKNSNDTLTVGETYYIRKAGDDNHNPSPATAFKAEIAKCEYVKAVKLTEDGTYGMKLNCKDMGEFIFKQIDGGWSIYNGENYLAMQDGKLVLSDTAFAWTYKNGAFSTSVKTEQKVKTSSYGLFGWLFGWGGKTTTKEVTTTYYLSTVADGVKLSTCSVCAELYTTVSGAHEFDAWIDCKDGTNHKHICKNCGEVETEVHEYDNNTHKCICGAYDPAESSVKISVDVKEKTSKQYVGWWFWGTWKDVTTYTANIKTEAAGVKVTKVQYQLNGGRWTTGTCVSSEKPIESLKVKAWDNNGNLYEYEWPEAPVPVTYMDWDGTKLVEKSTSDYIEVTSETTELKAGEFYVVKGPDVQTGTIIVNGTADKPTTLILMDGAKLTTTGDNTNKTAGIQVASGKALVITGQSGCTGELTATGGVRGAGIGGGDNGDGGTVTINGGTVTANGGENGAGIGGGYNGDGGTVNINGGTVTANGGKNGAGIGGGGDMSRSGGTVTINGGTVTANGGKYGAGIGGGFYGDGGTVNINGGTVTATGTYGEGIGGGCYIDNTGTVNFGTGVNFTINAGDDIISPMTTEQYSANHSAAYVSIVEVDNSVKYMDWDDTNKKLVEKSTTEYTEVTNETTTLDAGKFYVVKGTVSTAGLVVNGTAANPTTLILMDGAKLTVQGQVESYAGIQVTNDGSTCHALTITGQKNGTGTLIVTNAKYAAGIGGNDSDLSDADCGIITINGGIIETTGDQYGAGIGGGYVGNGGTVNINGGTVTATGGYGSAGIGGGGNSSTGGTVTINGGTVTATGGYYGAGIGGGNNGTVGTVTINGGTVTATGDDYGAGIGGGRGGNGGTVTINGGNVTATAGESAEAIGKSNADTHDTSGTVTFGEGVNFTINAGADKDNTSSKTTTEYAGDHSAAYVSIEKQ